MWEATKYLFVFKLSSLKSKIILTRLIMVTDINGFTQTFSTNTNTNTNTNITIITNMMYNLDSIREIRIQELILHDFYDRLVLPSELSCLSVDECTILIKQVLNTLESSTTTGFLTTLDLRNFPVISDLLYSFLQGDIDDSEAKDFVYGVKAMESYK